MLTTPFASSSVSEPLLICKSARHDPSPWLPLFCVHSDSSLLLRPWILDAKERGEGKPDGPGSESAHADCPGLEVHSGLSCYGEGAGSPLGHRAAPCAGPTGAVGSTEMSGTRVVLLSSHLCYLPHRTIKTKLVIMVTSY